MLSRRSGKYVLILVPNMLYSRMFNYQVIFIIIGNGTLSMAL